MVSFSFIRGDMSTGEPIHIGSAGNTALDTGSLSSSSSSSVWDRLLTWASQNKALVYTIAGVAVVVTGAGVVYYVSDSRKNAQTGAAAAEEKKRASKKERRKAKKAEIEKPTVPKSPEDPGRSQQDPRSACADEVLLRVQEEDSNGSVGPFRRPPPS